MYYNKYGYTWSKKIQNSFGDAPSPYFTPLLMSKLSYSYPFIETIPLLLTYIFLISYTKSTASLSSCIKASHNYCLFILSYALFKSTNIIPNFLPHFKLCYIHVWSIRAYSIVVWCALNPAYVGAWRSIALAYVVNRWFIAAMNTLASGGVTAMLL